MVPMTFIWWIYHFWARFWPYFNFVDFRAYFGPFSLVNRVQFSNADAGAWNSFLRLGIIFYGKLMYKDTKFCYSSFDISTFGFKAPLYWILEAKKKLSRVHNITFMHEEEFFCVFFSNALVLADIPFGASWSFSLGDSLSQTLYLAET